MHLAEIPQIQALSPREKLELIDEILKSVEPDHPALSAQEKAILDQRWAQFLKNPSSALTPEENTQRNGS